MKFVFSPDIILCSWLGSKHHLTNLTSEWRRNNSFFVVISISNNLYSEQKRQRVMNERFLIWPDRNVFKYSAKLPFLKYQTNDELFFLKILRKEKRPVCFLIWHVIWHSKTVRIFGRKFAFLKTSDKDRVILQENTEREKRLVFARCALCGSCEDV